MATKNIKAQMTAAEEEAYHDAKSAAEQAKFDKKPVFVQLLLGIGGLLAVAVIGFVALYAIDILFLDWDPIAKLVGLFVK